MDINPTTSSNEQKLTPLDEAKQLDVLTEDLRKKRLNYEKRWLVTDRFIDGKHFDTWNAEKNTFGTIKFAQGLNVRPIFYATKIAEGLLNNILGSDPRWQVYPVKIVGNSDEDKKNQEYARKLQKYFSSLWDIGNLTTQTIQLIWDGLKYGFGVFEVYWNSADNRPEITTISPYNILFDPTVSDIQDSQWIVKETSVPINRIKNNPIYSEYKNDIKDEGEVAPSPFQKVRLIEKYSSGTHLNKTAILKEVWQTNDDIGGWDVWHICQQKPLWHAHYDFAKPPFASWSYLPEPLLQTSFMEKLIPLNRAMDLTLAQIEMWVRTVAVGRMLKQAGVNIKRISGEEGEIIEANAPLDKIQWLPVPEIGSTPFNFLNELKGLSGESGAVSVTVGKVPSKKTGYKMIESLKASEISSIQHSIRRLETTLETLATNVLTYIYNFAKTPITVIAGKSSDDTFEIVSAMHSGEFVKAVPVSDRDFSVNVEIESGLAYTPDARRALAIELAKGGMIPTEVALEYLELGGDVSEIAEKAILETAQREQAKQGTVPSMVDTPDFKTLPPELQQQILQYKLGQTNQQQ